MSKIKKNLLANIIGKGWGALMSLIFVPFYIKFLGIEAYGLIGFFITLQALSSILDIGLSTTLNREMARLSEVHGTQQEIRNLVRTLELVYWTIAIFTAISLLFISPFISNHWIKSEDLSPQLIQQAALLMGLAVAIQLPFTLYSGGLLGLQKQVLLNYITAGIATLRGIGAVLTLWLVAPNILVFFLWQTFVNILQTIIVSRALWKHLPLSDSKPQFQKKLLMSVSRFAGSMASITILAILLTQLDKIILSKILPLESFGYYTLAGVVASSLYMIITPVFMAIFPRLSQLVSLNDNKGIVTLYHRSCQIMSALLIPPAMILIFFSSEILLIWTRSTVIAHETHLLVSLMVVGTTINGLMNIPYALQVAYGWTKLALYQNLISAVLIVPLLLFAAKRYGALGAAVIWIFLNLGYISIGVLVMHTKILKGEMLQYYKQDIGKPLLGALLIAFIARFLFPSTASQTIVISYLMFTSFLILLFTLFLTLPIRDWVQENIASNKYRFLKK